MDTQNKRQFIKIIGIFLVSIYFILIMPVSYFYFYFYFLSGTERGYSYDIRMEAVTADGLSALRHDFPCLLQMDGNQITSAETSFIYMYDDDYYYTFFYKNDISDEQFAALKSDFNAMGISNFSRYKPDDIDVQAKDANAQPKDTNVQPNAVRFFADTLDYSQWYYYVSRNGIKTESGASERMFFWLISLSILVLLIVCFRIWYIKVK